MQHGYIIALLVILIVSTAAALGFYYGLYKKATSLGDKRKYLGMWGFASSIGIGFAGAVYCIYKNNNPTVSVDSPGSTATGPNPLANMGMGNGPNPLANMGPGTNPFDMLRTFGQGEEPAGPAPEMPAGSALVSGILARSNALNMQEMELYS